MRIEIYVVETKIERLTSETYTQGKVRIEAYLKLLKCKTDLIRLFGGLTEIPDSLGYWINDKGEIEIDNVNLWLIYTKQNESELLNILLRIKKITKQTSQAYTINNEMRFL